MIEGAATSIMDHIQIIGRVVLVLMEPSMNVGPKGCALLLGAMDQTEASR